MSGVGTELEQLAAEIKRKLAWYPEPVDDVEELEPRAVLSSHASVYDVT